MPQKSVSDYKFVFVTDSLGKYLFRNTRGNIHRFEVLTFKSLKKTLQEHHPESELIELYGIANVQNFQTGEHTLVYDIYEDLREEDKDDCCRD